jgi:hypothetical protein
LSNDTDGTAAIVVSESDTPADALVAAIIGYHGGPATAANPVIQRYAEGVRIRPWRYCTYAWREFEGDPIEDYPSWWAENGDGKTSILVADFSDLDIFGIGDEALASNEEE